MHQDEKKPSKIIIDEDWKTQAQREKEELERRLSETSSKEEAALDGVGGPMPPPTLMTWISTIATQAAMGLGQIPDPITGKADISLEHAKYFIDSLQMLEDKTAGNRTDDESRTLTSLLHSLRLAYLDVGQALAARISPKA